MGGQLSGPALIVLAAAVASALYSLGQKPYLSRYSALQAAAYIVWTGTLFLFPLGKGLAAEISRAPFAATAACVYMGVVPGALGYVTWSYVLSKTPASRAGSYLYVIPVLALLIAWLWLGEVPAPISVLGGLLVLAGVIMVNARRSAGGRRRVRAGQSGRRRPGVRCPASGQGQAKGAPHLPTAVRRGGARRRHRLHGRLLSLQPRREGSLPAAAGGFWVGAAGSGRPLHGLPSGALGARLSGPALP